MSAVAITLIAAIVSIICYGAGNALDGLCQSEDDANEWDALGVVAKTAMGGIIIIGALCALIVIVVGCVLGTLAVTVAGTKRDPEKYTWNRHST